MQFQHVQCLATGGIRWLDHHHQFGEPLVVLHRCQDTSHLLVSHVDGTRTGQVVEPRPEQHTQAEEVLLPVDKDCFYEDWEARDSEVVDGEPVLRILAGVVYHVLGYWLQGV